MNKPAASIASLLHWANAQLVASDSASLDSRVLLSHCLQCTQAYLLTWPERIVSESQNNAFSALVARRALGHPIAHLVGHKAFWTLDLAVDPSTLIPRPETELLIEQALSLPLPSHSKVLDLGTGSGAIALALASERPCWQIMGVDKQTEAVKLAKNNANALQLTQVKFAQSDWFSNVIDKTFDLIISNPPYVEQDSRYLNEGDVRFEPRSALTSGADGLDDIRLITGKSKRYLAKNGWIMFEHGFSQSTLVQDILNTNEFENIATINDLNNQPRVTKARNNI